MREPSRRTDRRVSPWSPSTSRRSFLTACALVGGLFTAAPVLAAPGGGVGREGAVPPGGWPAAAEEVRAETVRAWAAYRRLAWGHDELRPLSGGYQEFFAAGHPMGLTIVEALDTLWLMEADEEVAQGLEWVDSRFDPDVDADFQVFETVIRLVGGLLSGYRATGERVLLERCRELADRLLPAFERSPTGAPWRHVNLRTGEVSGARNAVAEIGTNIAEFGELSLLTGDPRYHRAARRALAAVVERRGPLGLVGTVLDVVTGEWVGREATVNPPVDSFFEYLWDGWRLFGDEELLEWYRELTAAVLEHQLERVDGRVWFATVDRVTGERIHRRQSELTAFYAGLLAESGYPEPAASHHDAWTALLERWPLLPEEVDYGTGEATVVVDALRPEYVDAALTLWLVTGEERYRERAWLYYRRQRAACATPNGWTALADATVSPPVRADLTPGYWWSEQTKYWYLLFSGTDRFDYRDNYLTTEGNVLRGLRR